MKAIDLLPPKRRQAIIMYYLNGLDKDMIAQAMDIEGQTLNNHLSQGIKDLRRLYIDMIICLLMAGYFGGGDA
jgi:DNA-directed RNA polymerase specialized sigma24 family protein